MAKIVGVAAFAMASLIAVGTAQTTTALGSCDTWDCGGAEYVDTLLECLTSDQARRKLACDELPTDDDFWTDGEYTVDDDDYVSTTDSDDTPVCSQELCCEPSPTPQPALAPTVIQPAAPPVSGPVSTCLNGFEGIDGFGSYCCPIGCNQCGGNGCGSAGAENGLSGAECCGGGVKSSGIYCDDVEAPPCIYGASPSPSPSPEPTPTPNPSPTPEPPTPTPEPPTPTPEFVSTCLNGFEGIDGFGSYCCPIGCNKCGGNGCGSAGAENGLSGTECCGGGVKSSGIYCDDVEAPPCIYGASPSPSPSPDPTPTPNPSPTPTPPTPTPEPPTPSEPVSTCRNGFEGIDGFGVYCCPIGCIQCGGNGCSTSGAENGLGNSECCGGGVKRAGVYCADSGAPPCLY